MLSIHGDNHYMRLALQEAQRAFEEEEIPVGAIVICKNRVVAKAYNQVFKLNDATGHAEMLAITAAQNFLGSRYLDQCTLYVTLEPCVMCAGALYWARIGKIVFGAPDEKRGYRITDPSIVHPTTAVESGVLQDECAALVKDFFKKIRGKR